MNKNIEKKVGRLLKHGLLLQKRGVNEKKGLDEKLDRVLDGIDYCELREGNHETYYDAVYIMALMSDAVNTPMPRGISDDIFDILEHLRLHPEDGELINDKVLKTL